MSVLLGCLIGVGRLSADQEWVALQAAGQGPRRLLIPLAVHGLLFTIVSFAIVTEVVPKAAYRLREMRGLVLLSSNLAADLKPRVFYTELNNVVLFVDEIEAGSKGRLEGVLLVQKDPQDQSSQFYLADYGYLSPAPDGSGALLLDLHDGVAHLYDADESGTYSQTRFDSVRRRFEPAAFLQALREPPTKVVQDFTTRELLEEHRVAREAYEEEVARLDMLNQKSKASEKREAKREGVRLVVKHRFDRATVELHQRMALPLACLVFSVLSLPLGITRVRSGKGAGFALSLLIILIYWATFTFFRDQALHGRFPPRLGPWMANLVLLPWAAWGLFRLRRPPAARGGLVMWIVSSVVRTYDAVRARRAKRHHVAPPDADADVEQVTEELESLGGTSGRFIARLDQYIGTVYVRVLIFSILSCYLVFALVEAKSLTDGLLRTGESPQLLLSYLQYFWPGVLPIVLPISCLIGAVVAMTLLTRSGELTAVKAAGISMRRATFSVLVLTTLLSGFLFLVDDRIAPSATRRADQIKDQILGRAPRTYGMSQAGRWSFGPEGHRLYHYQHYDPDRGEFLGLRVFTLDEGHRRVLDHRFHTTARWRGTDWELGPGWYREFDGLGGEAYEGYEEPIELALDGPEGFRSAEGSLRKASHLQEEMSLVEMDRQMEALERRGYDVTQLRVAYHGKLAKAATPLVMVLLGLPFAFKVGRRGSLYGIGVALLLVLVYWAVFAVFNAMGLETLLDPRVAAWAPNVLFALFGVYLMLYIKT
jgi:LPS export ABC transporter permease LptG